MRGGDAFVTPNHSSSAFNGDDTMNPFPICFASANRSRHAPARGVSLIVVLLLLVIVSMLGVASMQISMMGERGARNDRDMQLAWQSSEAALIDAEIDLQGPNTASGSRTASLLAGPTIPDSGCATSDANRGICNFRTTGSTKPTWLTVDFTKTSNNPASVALGTYTGRSLSNADEASGSGIQPALSPRYVIEDMSRADAANAGGRMVGTAYASRASAGTRANQNRLYRITAMGFGPRSDIQAATQTIFRN